MTGETPVPNGYDTAPGDRYEDTPGLAGGLRTYLLGLAFAAALTAASFWIATANFIYAPAIPMALVVLAIAQMGIHIVFFLHITTSPDNTNNVMALAFGVLIVCLVIFGSLWIMAHMNHNMMPATALMRMQQ